MSLDERMNLLGDDKLRVDVVMRFIEIHIIVLIKCDYLSDKNMGFANIIIRTIGKETSIVYSSASGKNAQ